MLKYRPFANSQIPNVPLFVAIWIKTIQLIRPSFIEAVFLKLLKYEARFVDTKFRPAFTFY